MLSKLVLDSLVRDGWDISVIKLVVSSAAILSCSSSFLNRFFSGLSIKIRGLGPSSDLLIPCQCTENLKKKIT